LSHRPASESWRFPLTKPTSLGSQLNETVERLQAIARHSDDTWAQDVAREALTALLKQHDEIERLRAQIVAR
jgi:hypothetical protein